MSDLPTPITREEQYLNRIASGSGVLPATPITRSEQYLEKIATGLGELPAFPITRSEIYLDYIATHGSGGGITAEPLTVTENGTYTAPSDKAYTPVTVNVPQGEPTEVSTSDDMDALLVSANVGKAYLFTGETDDTYTNGDIYVVEEGA